MPGEQPLPGPQRAASGRAQVNQATILPEGPARVARENLRSPANMAGERERSCARGAEGSRYGRGPRRGSVGNRTDAGPDSQTATDLRRSRWRCPARPGRRGRRLRRRSGWPGPYYATIILRPHRRCRRRRWRRACRQAAILHRRSIFDRQSGRRSRAIAVSLAPAPASNNPASSADMRSRSLASRNACCARENAPRTMIARRIAGFAGE